MNPLKQVKEYGQSIWMDYIRRNLITSGELKRLIDFDGVSGLTSNPTIFEKAIDENTDYDAELRKLLDADPRRPTFAIYENLMLEDIRMAADVLRPVYDSTGGTDGYVSIEVSPKLAHNTVESINEARRLWKEVDRPNLMVKIPATREGIPAIEALLAEGININITLMFSLAHYDAVTSAFLAGAARCPNPRKLASVASIFVSRVDTKVDRALEAIGTPEALALRGKIAIANAKTIYQRFRQVFHTERFQELRKRGLRLQRVLWGSTGTKNPAYSDVLYMEELIGPDTVNTVPVATLNAFREHGRVRSSAIMEGADEARADLERLRKLGIDLAAVTEDLQNEGVEAFNASMEKLLASLEKKRDVYV
ncbi:MAG TPA: transaldolase [Bryobacteraceae bacterium]|nr:transaldolase [Bryobacteraceae bacterium]